MGKIIAIANQKGGVSKTTTAVNLSAALARYGYNVLCVDLDPQSNASYTLGYEPDGMPTFCEILTLAAERSPQLAECVSASLRQNSEGVYYIPAQRTLSAVQKQIDKVPMKETLLKRVLDLPFFEPFHFIILDCPPSLDTLLQCALMAANSILIPVQLELYAYQGLGELMDNVRLYQEGYNPTLHIEGLVATMVNRTILGATVKDMLSDEYAELLFSTTISERTEVGQSATLQRSVVSIPKSVVGQEYISLSKELIERMKERGY